MPEPTDALLNPENVLHELDLRTGMTVADFGCGTLGHFVFPAAKYVGESGKVYAVDILKSVLEGVTNRAKLERAGNVEPLWSDIERPNGISLPDGSVDVGLLVNNLFLAKDKLAVVRECARTVTHGGTFVIVDWKPSGVSFGPMFEGRISAVEASKIAQEAGLEPLREFEPGTYHYAIIFKKP